jgi:hypothetical protein
MSFKALDREFEEVVIIDLLPEGERQSWRISEELRQHLAQLGIPQMQLSCFHKKHVFQALDWCLDRLKGSSFVLQFTAHGNDQGVGMKATSEFIKWEELREPFQKINRGLQGELVVNMIACQGIEGVGIQTLEDPLDPFFGIVGPQIKIEVSEAKTVCNQFYEKLRDGIEIPYIVRDINVSLKKDVLWCHAAQRRRQKSGGSLGV